VFDNQLVAPIYMESSRGTACNPQEKDLFGVLMTPTGWRVLEFLMSTDTPHPLTIGGTCAASSGSAPAALNAPGAANHAAMAPELHHRIIEMGSSGR